MDFTRRTQARQDREASKNFHFKETFSKTVTILGEVKVFKNELGAKEIGKIQDHLYLEDPSRLGPKLWCASD